MNKTEIILRRLYNSGLIHKFERVDVVVSQLFGIQSQYLNHALFNLYNRTNEVGDNQTILAWGQRNTLHIYDLKTWQKINKFLNQQTWVPKYYRQKGINLASEIDYFYQIVSGKEMLLNDLKSYYKDRWSPVFDWSALLLELSRRGYLYITLDSKNRKQLHINKHIVCDDINPSKIAHQFFEVYGPATLDDLSHFFGTPKSFWNDKIIFNDLEQFELDNQTFFYFKDNLLKINVPDVILLGKFDPLLVAYHKKDILVPKEYHQQIWGKGGQISPIILVKGQFAGTWRFRASQNRLTYTISLMEKYNQPYIHAEISKKIQLFSEQMNKNKITYVWKNFKN